MQKLRSEEEAKSDVKMQPEPATTEQPVPDAGDLPAKVGKLTQREREEKIRKYLDKKSRRGKNANHYPVRKNLADKRQRNKGRFVKGQTLGWETKPRPEPRKQKPVFRTEKDPSLRLKRL